MKLISNKGKEEVSGVFFTSDTHFFHKNIIKYCNRPFSSVEEMNEGLIENWNNTVSDTDIVYCLGDVVLGRPSHWEAIIPRLNGRIRLILGNHDLQYNYHKKIFEQQFESVSLMEYIIIDKQPIYLCHFPLVDVPKNALCLCGHVHSSSDHKFDLGDNVYDVGVDNNNYTPISFEQIKIKII